MNKSAFLSSILLYQGDFIFQSKTFRMNALEQAIGHQYVRLLEKYKIILFLSQDCLEVRLYFNEKHPHFFRGIFQYEHLPIIFKSVFRNLEEIFVEFKAIKEDQIFFAESQELIYSIPLATKSLELAFPLAPVTLNRLEQVLLDNQVLQRIKGDYQVILRQKDMEISELKQELAECKTALQKLSITNNNKRSNITPQRQLSNPVNLQIIDQEQDEDADPFKQKQSSPQRQSLKRQKIGNSLWSLPSAKYFKDSEGNMKKLSKLGREQFNFFIAKDAKHIQYFQYRNSRLKLLADANEEPYRIVPIDKFDSDHRNIFGVRLINQNSRLIRIGILCLKNEVYIEEQQADQQVYYDLKAGITYTYTSNGCAKAALVPVKANDTLHVTISPGQGSMGWYHNELLVKEFRLTGSFLTSNLMPYVQMGAEGDEIEFL